MVQKVGAASGSDLQGSAPDCDPFKIVLRSDPAVLQDS